MFGDGPTSNISVASDDCFTGNLHLTVSIVASVSLLVLALSLTVFIIVTVVLVKAKLQTQRELKQARVGDKQMTTHATPYEEIDVNLQLAPSAIISTRENIAYGHVSRI